ncbi:alpha/beta fold hydrolase [Nocardia sp. NPDC004860]|uniref:alpha/beta fold hydrolase n=1 Tax=Nocardia sp. NPDC004860 TaxID=3154557 RepID=UPI0033B2A99C
MNPLSLLNNAIRQLSDDLDVTARYTHNALRHFSGVGAAKVGSSARKLIWRRDKVRLFRYVPPDTRPRSRPILLVMSLVTKATIFDLIPQSSLVRALLADGHDVFLLDWGVPDAVEAANTLETYSGHYLPHAVRVVSEHVGAQPVSILGYCLGGVLSTLTAAAHPELPIRSLALLATPIDFAELGPGMAMLSAQRLEVGDLLDETGNVPAATLVEAFKMIQPGVDITTYTSLWRSFADERALRAHQAIVGWSKDQIPFPGATMSQICELFLHRRELVSGRVSFAGRTVQLSEVQMPVLHVTGTLDKLVPAAASGPLPQVLSGADVSELTFPIGHVGLLYGRLAVKKSVPAISQWLAATDS